jgi:hypothetical protein
MMQEFLTRKHVLLVHFGIQKFMLGENSQRTSMTYEAHFWFAAKHTGYGAIDG